MAAAARGWHVNAVDISTEMILAARRTVDSSDPEVTARVSLRVRDLRRPPDDWNGKFDAVICVTAMQHIPRGHEDKDLREVLTGFHRVLRPAGVLRTDVRLGLESGYDPDLRYVEAFNNEKDVVDLMEQVGFEIIDKKPIHKDSGDNSFRRPIQIDYVILWARKTV
jgi:SAM-dependent methyltransferase